FSVADNGPGVPPDQREKIFQPFHSTKGHGGTGLGLAVVRKSVKEMGGKIRLNSPEEGGAEFVVRFPVSPSRAPASGDTHGPGSRSGSG
ncbi:MAG: HAMP domain-containing histidine kinase, partial [Phycisphaerae bacterium]|nr:HAMP domain-containing histidine kinase [Phycisphaerae bacterium]